jgi:hypothetical protein
MAGLERERLSLLAVSPFHDGWKALIRYDISIFS